MIRAVLFDFDGLIADSEPLQKAAWDRYLALHDRVLDQALLDRMFGLRVQDSAALVREVLALPFTVEQVMADRDAIFLDSLAGALRPMPLAGETVQTARALGLHVALASSGHRRYLAAALHEIGLSNVFDAIVSGDMVQRGKPAPDIFLRAAAELGMEPSACVVVEDAPHGIAAAKAAGMIAVAVPNELTRDLDFRAADYLFLSLHEFCAWLTDQVQGAQL